MKKRLLALANASLATIALVCTTIAAPLSTAFATPPTGNNGTLKVHEIGTPSGTENNDPKVCAFNFDGFGFDNNQSGYILIKTQGGSQPVGQDAGPFSFGPTNGNGYAVSQNFNTVGGTPIVNGTYKATLYGKDTGGNIDLRNDKAKSKVFKVDCAPVATPVTPAEATFSDTCGTVNDTYTIPATLGAVYKIDGTTQTAGSYPATGTVTVEAMAADGYKLEGTTNWSHTFTNEACPTVRVKAKAPVKVNISCDKDGSYTIPEKTGVVYKVDGVVTTAGIYTVSGPKTVKVTAEAADGYTLYGTTSWTLNFYAPRGCDCDTPPPPPPVDVCPNLEGNQSQVPEGMEKDEQGNCYTPGRGGDDTPTPPAPTPTPSVPVVLTASQPAAAPVVQSQAKLVDTGVSTQQTTLVAVVLTVLALGVAVLSNRKTAKN
ncbi:hypothetical protein EYC58_00120 [Candidatus Saccharibacteria bacterium]|nr:MAG: hypothetical protein EYC58_00120 [Candidatus Saccharibacteria bacterium]